MRDVPLIPDDLPTCQQLLRDFLAKLFASETQFEQACTTSEALHAKVLQLTQERDKLKLTIERLLHRLYGRRSERHEDAAGQLHLDFGDLPVKDETPSPPEFEDVTSCIAASTTRRTARSTSRRAAKPSRGPSMANSH